MADTNRPRVAHVGRTSGGAQPTVADRIERARQGYLAWVASQSAGGDVAADAAASADGAGQDGSFT